MRQRSRLRRGYARRLTDVRQVQRRVRHLRHLRPSRGGEPRLPRPLRAAASRPGERRHRRGRRSPRASCPRTWATSPTSSLRAPRPRSPGTSAIGHARYSTAGDSGLTNAQPILIDCAHGQIAIAHNGNLVNAQELRDHLVRLGSIFQTSSDTEVILHLFARSRAATVEDAIVESISQVRGAFSLVHADAGPADRRARSARLPAAGARQARRRLGGLLGDLRAWT